MPQHSERSAGELQSGHGVGGIAAVQRRGHLTGNTDGAAQPVQPCLLIGPDIAQQRQLTVGAGGVQRRDVIAVTLDDVQSGGRGRQFALPCVVDGDRRIGWAPVATRIAVTIVVGTQIETGAAADLEKPCGQIESVGQQQQTADQCGRAADLVGLRRLVESGTQILGVLGGGLHDVGPPGLGVPVSADAGIPAAQRRCASLESQPVQSAQQSQRQRHAAGVVFMSGEDLGEHTVGFDVAGHQSQQLAVHRRTHARADLTLHRDGLQQSAHGSISFSPARTTSKASPRACGSETDSSSSQCS